MILCPRAAAQPDPSSPAHPNPSETLTNQGFPLVLFGFDEVPYHTDLVREMQIAARNMRGKVATIFIPTDQLDVLREFQLPPRAVPVSRAGLRQTSARGVPSPIASH